MEHSKVKDAIMFPYYKHYNGHESLLSKDDIAGVQALYGSYILRIFVLLLNASSAFNFERFSSVEQHYF